MKASLQTKLLAMCTLLVLLTTVGISGAYYLLTKRDKQQESQQRIQIAFDIILDDTVNRLDTYQTRFAEFLKDDEQLLGWLKLYTFVDNSLRSIGFISGNMAKITDELKKFGQSLAADRLLLYGADKRLLAIYSHHNGAETIGGYVISNTGNDTYLPMIGASSRTWWRRRNPFLTRHCLMGLRLRIKEQFRMRSRPAYLAMAQNWESALCRRLGLRKGSKGSWSASSCIRNA
jgi:hypothetical protein